MKHTLLTFLGFISLLLVASCSDSSSANEFEAQQVGYWYVDSPHSAQYTGSNHVQTMKANIGNTISSIDTVSINQPGQINVHMVTSEDSTSTFFAVFFDDSTLTETDHIERDLVPALHIASNDSSAFDIRGSGYTGIGPGEILQTYFYGYYTCNSTPGTPVFYQSIYENNDTTSVPIKVYTLNAAGFSDVLDYMVCGSAL